MQAIDYMAIIMAAHPVVDGGMWRPALDIDRPRHANLQKLRTESMLHIRCEENGT